MMYTDIYMHADFLHALFISKDRIFQSGALHMDSMNFYFDMYIVLFCNLWLDSTLQH